METRRRNKDSVALKEGHSDGEQEPGCTRTTGAGLQHDDARMKNRVIWYCLLVF